MKGVYTWTKQYHACQGVGSMQCPCELLSFIFYKWDPEWFAPDSSARLRQAWGPSWIFLTLGRLAPWCWYLAFFLPLVQNLKNKESLNILKETIQISNGKNYKTIQIPHFNILVYSLSNLFHLKIYAYMEVYFFLRRSIIHINSRSVFISFTMPLCIYFHVGLYSDPSIIILKSLFYPITPVF